MSAIADSLMTPVLSYLISYRRYKTHPLSHGQLVLCFQIPPMASAFFYGTLMHPKILKRVIGNDGFYLQISPALLPVSGHQPISGV